MLVELLAWAGAALSALLCVPQAVRTIRARQLDGVSATTYWIVLANAAIRAPGRCSPESTQPVCRHWSAVLRLC
jgi:hypothetical protein